LGQVGAVDLTDDLYTTIILTLANSLSLQLVKHFNIMLPTNKRSAAYK